MKSNKNFVLRNIYGEYILMPVRRDPRINSPILLNKTSADIFELANKLSSKEKIAISILKDYGLEINDKAHEDICKCIDTMISMGLLEE